MGMRIDNTEMIKLLPEWMQNDEANGALASAVDKLISRVGKRIKTPRVWDQFEEMTEYELDEMAWELGIDWYNSAWNKKQKIDVIKTYGPIMEKRGTVWAVEKLVTAIFGIGEIFEWFEYGGKPYFFKIRTSALLTQDGMKDFLSKVKAVKNERSHIESIEILRITELNAVMGQGYLSIHKPAAIMPAITLYRTATGNTYQGMHGVKIMHPAAIMMSENIVDQETVGGI